MLALVLKAVIVAYLPGAVIFRWPGSTRGTRAGLSIDERLFWATIISLVWSLGVVIALAAAGRYTFTSLLGINLAASLAVAAALNRRLRYTEPVDRRLWPLVAPAALIALGVWLYLPASEYIVGGKDPGSYINEGIQIAQRGHLVVNDPVVASVPPPFRNLFFPSHNNPTYYGIRFIGYYIRDVETGAVIGQFPQLYPASIAVGYGLNGLSGARQTGPVWAILGLLAVYFTGAHLFGRLPAAAGAALVGLNVVQVWFARYPTTEVVMQTCTFAAVLALARAVDGARPFFGIVAGVLGALMLFLRVDAVLVIAALAGAAALAPAVNKRAGAGFWIALVAMGVLGLWYLLGPMRAYMAYPVDFVQNSGGFWIVAIGAIALVLVPRLVTRPAIGTFVSQWVPILLALVLTALAIYAYFFRQEGGRLALSDAMAFRTFGWYITPPVLGLAVAGLAWFIVTRFWTSPAFFLVVAVFGFFFFYKTRIVHEHFWAARRLLPVILPGALLVMPALVWDLVGPHRLGRLWRGAANSVLVRAVGAALLLVLTAPVAMAFWRATAEIRHHVEYAGLIPRIETLAARFGDRDLLLVEGRDAGSDLHVLAMPLAYIYARQVLVLDSAVPDKRRFEAFVDWARTRYDNVWFLGSGGTDLLTARVMTEPVASETFQVPEYASVVNAYPTGSRQKEFDFGIYRLVAATPPTPGPIRLDIGQNDDVNVVRFHAKERRGDTGITFRWSRGLSYVFLQGVAPTARELTIWMSSGGRPAQAPVPEVSLSLAGHALGRVTLVDEVRPYRFPIPPQLAPSLAATGDPARLELRVSTWSPSAVLRAPDTRELGALVTRVEVQ